MAKRLTRILKRFHGRRGWILRLLLMAVVPLLFFGILEGGLRLFGYGYPTGFFVSTDGITTTNVRFGWRFFPRELSREPYPCRIASKPEGTIRIFVVGGSAAMGTPEASLGVSKILDLMLHERYPDKRFEVINAAMTAINSYVALEIVRDCSEHDPDLFIVYMGNNEVIGPYGPATIFQEQSRSLGVIRASLWAKSTRTGQLLGSIIGTGRRDEAAPTGWRGMEMFLDTPIAQDDPRLNTVYSNYRQELTHICTIATRAHAAVILSTVAVNMRDFPPLSSRHRPGLTPTELEEWQSRFNAGNGSAVSNRWGAAINSYREAAAIDGSYAELHYRMGRALLCSGSPEEARHHFQSACDLDVLRFRADSHINAAIRQVASEQQAAGVRLVDAAKEIATHNPEQTTSTEEAPFYEHVHLTFSGNYLLARALLDQVSVSLPQLAGQRRNEVGLSRQQCASLLAFTQWDEYLLVENMTKMTARPPFTHQPDHEILQASADLLKDRLRDQASRPQAVTAARNSYQAALARTPGDWSLHYRYGLLAAQWAPPDFAVEQFRVALDKLPGDACRYRHILHRHIARALVKGGRRTEAITHFEKALELVPRDAATRVELAEAFDTNAQPAEADAQYSAAIATDAETALSHITSRGNALAERGRFDEAIVQYKKVLALDPNYSTAHLNIGGALAASGQTEAAIQHLGKALELTPADPDVHANLGGALRIAGRPEEAAQYLSKALELRPGHAAAKRNLDAIQQSKQK